MDGRNQNGVLTQFTLAHVFPETCPMKLGEHVVQHPDTGSRKVSAAARGAPDPIARVRNIPKRLAAGPHDAAISKRWKTRHPSEQ